MNNTKKDSTHLCFTDIRPRYWDQSPRKGSRWRISHFERAEGDDDCLERARQYRNRRRKTNLKVENVNEIYLLM